MIDKNTLEQVRSTDMVSFFEKYHGFTFAHRGGMYRCHQHPSLAVKNDRLSWYWHSKSKGGFGVLDYLTKVEGMPFRDAVNLAAGIGIAPSAASPKERIIDRPRTLVLPKKRGLSLCLYDYLCVKRGIDSEIVNTLMQKNKLYEDGRGNVVFVGHDERGRPRFASVRGTRGGREFRGDCAGSDKQYGFNMAACAPSERLYLFESPIDAMSHASLENAVTGATGAWKRENRLSLAGTSDTALPFFLNQHPAVRELVFCLDNDPAGREATVLMAREYAARGYAALIDFPKGKDFNVDLQAYKGLIPAQNRTQNKHR